MQWTEFIQAGFWQYTSSSLILSYMTHMTPFLPSKFLEGHTMNIVQNSPTDLSVGRFYQPMTDINISIYIVRYENLLFKNYKYRMEKVTPAVCVSTGDKTADVRKCNSYLTNG